MIPKLNPTLFDWIIWRNGGPLDVFGLQLRVYNIQSIAPLIRKHAIGYCDAATLVCRPKLNHKAVMFEVDSKRYWFHVTNAEFDLIFEK